MWKLQKYYCATQKRGVDWRSCQTYNVRHGALRGLVMGMRQHCLKTPPVSAYQGNMTCESMVSPRNISVERRRGWRQSCKTSQRSEEHTSELQSLRHLVCRL